MSDRRIVVVSEMLDSLPPGMDPERVAVAIVAALDADARRRPFIGIVPPVRLWADRDRGGEVEEPEVTLEEAVGVEGTRAAVTVEDVIAAISPGIYPGLDEFHKDTSHHPGDV